MLPEEQPQQQQGEEDQHMEEQQQDYSMDEHDSSDNMNDDDHSSLSNDDQQTQSQSQSSSSPRPATAFIQFVMIPVVRNENGEQVEDREQAFTGHFLIPWSMLSNSNSNSNSNIGNHNGGEQRQQRIMNLLYYMYQMQQQQAEDDDEKKLGTDRKQIDALPVYSIQHTCPYQQQFGDCNRECTICLCESTEDGEQWMILPCGHSFHKDCLLPWLDNHHTCPSCRLELEMANVDLERERVARIAREYGEDGLKLMNLSTSIHNMYSQYQKLVVPPSDTDEKPAGNFSMFKLNEIDASLTSSMYQLDSVTFPSLEESEQQQQPYQKWDQNRTRSVKKQLIHRIQYLQSMMDKMRASGGLPSCTPASPLYPQASAL